MVIKVKAKYSRKYKHPWILINENTGEIVDDAQGYGYRTAQKAHASWAYRHRSPKSVHNHKSAKKWWQKHKELAKGLDEDVFEIAKGSWDEDDKFDLNLLKN